MECAAKLNNLNINDTGKLAIGAGLYSWYSSGKAKSGKQKMGCALL
jgi:hypothetical protein